MIFPLAFASADNTFFLYQKYLCIIVMPLTSVCELQMEEGILAH
jgi:hypothetical protein